MWKYYYIHESTADLWPWISMKNNLNSIHRHSNEALGYCSKSLLAFKLFSYHDRTSVIYGKVVYPSHNIHWAWLVSQVAPWLCHLFIMPTITSECIFGGIFSPLSLSSIQLKKYIYPPQCFPLTLKFCLLQDLSVVQLYWLTKNLFGIF